MGGSLDRVKKEITPDIRSIEVVDQRIGKNGLIYNWCQEYEGELNNAGVDDPAFFEKRIAYCREFVELLPESDPLIIENMRKAEAESYLC